MLNLISNEYIKLFKKKSTWIWLLLVVIMSVGFIGAIKIYQNLNHDYDYDDYYYSKERYEEELGFYKTNKNKESDIEIKYYESLIENNIYDYNWKMDAINEAYRICYYNVLFGEEEGLTKEEQDKYDGYSKKLIDAVKDDNYVLYLEYKADTVLCSKFTFNDADKGIPNIYKYMIDNKIEPDFESDKYKILNQINDYQIIMEECSSEPSKIKEYNEYKKKWLIELYKLENNLTENITNSRDIHDIMIMSNSVWKYFKLSEKMIILISVFMVVIAGGIVASEYSQGTIKFLLINPKNRTKILFSKLITVLSFAVITTVIMFIVNFIASMLIGEFKGMDAAYLLVNNGKVNEYPAIMLLIKEYAVRLIEVVLMATMAFAISALLKKSAMSTGVGVACLVGGTTITTMLASFNLDWGRYLIFANLDLLSISEGNSLYVEHSLIGAIINISIHMIVFILTAHDAFVRREV